jgi:ferredoxin
MSEDWTVVADLDLCQGHQMCRLDAPELFGFDKAADKVVVRRPQVPAELHAAARRAVAGCPAMALSIVESQNPQSTPVKED